MEFIIVFVIIIICIPIAISILLITRYYCEKCFYAMDNIMVPINDNNIEELPFSLQQLPIQTQAIYVQNKKETKETHVFLEYSKDENKEYGNQYVIEVIANEIH